MSAAWRDNGDIVLACLIQPRAGRDAISGEHDGAVKIRIAAPPAEGRANARLLGFLAKQFGVAKGGVTLESGATGKRKRVRITAPTRIPAGIPLPP